jgi:hypothetical protein
VGRTIGHLNGYSVVIILHSNHRETQYSQLWSAPTLIATRLKANTENRPIDPKQAEKDLFGSGRNCNGINVGGGSMVHAVP